MELFKSGFKTVLGGSTEQKAPGLDSGAETVKVVIFFVYFNATSHMIYGM